MGRRLVAAAVVTGSIILASAGAAFASPAGDLTAKTNAERTSRGLRALDVRSDLVSVALAHSKRMAAKGGIYHNPDLAEDVDGWTVVGENVGVGSSISKIHEAFMASTGHRANILDKAYTSIGIGVYEADGKLWVTEVFAKFGSTSKSSGGSSSTGSSSSGSTSKASAPKVSTQSAAQAVPVARPAVKRPVIRERARTVDVLRRLIEL